jgi:hypothetical protein
MLRLTATNLLPLAGLVVRNNGASVSAVSKVKVLPVNLLPAKSLIAVEGILTL